MMIAKLTDDNRATANLWTRPLISLGVLIMLFAAAGCATKPMAPDPAFAVTKPVATAPAPVHDGAIFHAGTDVVLFEDLRARRIGDILTIVLSERTTANKQANTSTSRETGVDIANPTLFGRQLPLGNGTETLEQNLQSDNEFDGQGTSSQSNTLSGTLAVTVAEVLANGYMMVRGEKLLTLNQGDEYVRISGIVRPEDIGPDNSVLSTQVANARIVYGGKGALADANANGWLARFFQSSWWPW